MGRHDRRRSHHGRVDTVLSWRYPRARLVVYHCVLCHSPELSPEPGGGGELVQLPNPISFDLCYRCVHLPGGSGLWTQAGPPRHSSSPDGGVGLCGSGRRFLAAYNVTVYFAVPQWQELQLMRQQLARANLGPGTQHLLYPSFMAGFVRSGRAVRRVRFSLFGPAVDPASGHLRSAARAQPRGRANLPVELAPLDAPAETASRYPGCGHADFVENNPSRPRIDVVRLD